MCGRQAPVLCWYSLGCSLLGQGSTNLDTGCQEKTSWIIHWTLITASVTCTGECRMGTPELGSTVVYFNELLPLLRKLLSLLCSTERPRGVGGTKLWISAFEHWQTTGKPDWAHHTSRQVWGTVAKNCLLPFCPFLSPKSNQVILGKKQPGLGEDSSERRPNETLKKGEG